MQSSTNGNWLQMHRRESADGQMDGRTDGRYQAHYLPALRSIKSLMTCQWIPIDLIIPAPQYFYNSVITHCTKYKMWMMSLLGVRIQCHALCPLLLRPLHTHPHEEIAMKLCFYMAQGFKFWNFCNRSQSSHFTSTCYVKLMGTYRSLPGGNSCIFFLNCCENRLICSIYYKFTEPNWCKLQWLVASIRLSASALTPEAKHGDWAFKATSTPHYLIILNAHQLVCELHSQ